GRVRSRLIAARRRTARTMNNARRADLRGASSIAVLSPPGAYPDDLDALEVMNPGPGRWRSLLGEVLFGLFVVAGWRVRVRRVDEGEHPGGEWLRRKQPQRLLGQALLVEPHARA